MASDLWGVPTMAMESYHFVKFLMVTRRVRCARDIYDVEPHTIIESSAVLTEIKFQVIVKTNYLF